MIQYERPTPPATYPTRAILDARAAVAQAVANGLAPSFPEHWGQYKSIFAKKQHDKCGFCESCVTTVHWGAVEHHAPKAEVQWLQDPGAEGDYTSNLKEARRTPTLHATGYHWRAYLWENWLYACDRCNSAWKRCL